MEFDYPRQDPQEAKSCCIPIMCFAFKKGSEVDIVEVHLNTATLSESLSNPSELISEIAAAVREVIASKIAAGCPPMGFCVLHASDDYPGEHECEVCNPSNSNMSGFEGGALSKVDFEEVRKHFDKPIAKASEALGICTTNLKRACRQNGVLRWPYRQVKMADRKIESTQLAAEEIMTAPGFQKLRQDLLQDVSELKSRRDIMTNAKRRLESRDDLDTIDPQQV